MKKIAVFAVCLFLLAALIRGLGVGFGPTILTVQVYDAAGADITQSVRVFVGAVADDARKTPTLGNISVIKPKAASSNRYEVPSNHAVAVFVFENAQPQQHIFRLKPGEERVETIVLN